MRIGFDLDRVFINTPPGIPAWVIERLYKKKPNGKLEYRIPSTPEQFIRQISHHYIFRPSIKNNIAFLKSLPRSEHELYLISSRYGFLKDHTEKILKRYGLSDTFDAMYFNTENKQPHEFKNAVLKKLQLDIFIDDDFHLIKYAAKENKKTRFFWLNNRQEGMLSRNMFAIKNLSDAFNK